MQAPADLFLFAGITILSLSWMYVVGRIQKAEIKMKKRRTAARRGITNIGRKQAVLALSSEVIRKG